MTGTPEHEQWKRDMAQADVIIQKLREHPRIAWRVAEKIWGHVAGPWRHSGGWSERPKIGGNEPRMAYVYDNGRGWWGWKVWIGKEEIEDDHMSMTREEACEKCDAILDSRGVILP